MAYKDPAVEKVQRKKRIESHRAILLERLGGRCVSCGTTERLEFDHKDPLTVSFRIGHRLSNSLEVLFSEAEKCQLLCNPCHWDKTRKDRGLNKAVHGTASMYTNKQCRCGDCRTAWAAYIRKRKSMR